MSAALFTHLSWLVPAPADFRQRAKNWQGASDPEAYFRYLASHALNLDQLEVLARQLKLARAANIEFAGCVPVKLAIVSNATADHILPALTATALRHGLLLDIVAAPYGQTMQAAAGQVEAIRDTSIDAVLCAIDAQGLATHPGLFSQNDSSVDSAVDYVMGICDGLSAQTSAPCIAQNLAMPAETSFGSLESQTAGAGGHFTMHFNGQLAERIHASDHHLLDIGGLAATIGTADWHDPKLYALAKMPFSQQAVPLYAEHALRLLAALKGKSRRCLVLDLDNTLWGGVIGDDGLTGIRIGQGDPVGEAHHLVQAAALALRARGIVLAVSSKNEDAIAREAFHSHPDMLLREDDIAVFQANWSDKATNIRAIADKLSLGLDSLVFLDDNPAERALVRRELPQVAVPELPDDPALFARTLLAGGYFESVHFSAEDTARADDYQAQAKRLKIKESAVDMGAFLESLQMIATVSPFQNDSIKRIAQLVNKSNQFNLTTQRYSEKDIDGLCRQTNCRTWQVRLADSFGDNGLISVIIGFVDGDTLDIDTWLMSCRVLGRRVEEMVLDQIVADAGQENIRLIRGRYLPTARNMMVAEHYPRLGFAPLQSADVQDEASTAWQLDVSQYVSPALPFTVLRR